VHEFEEIRIQKIQWRDIASSLTGVYCTQFLRSLIELLLLHKKVCLKLTISYHGCKFMRFENISPYFTFIPTGKLVFNYARQFSNASLA